MRGVALEDALDLGRLMVLDTGSPWDPEPFQVAVIDALCRGVTRVWLEIPEGNAKTTLAAIIGLIHLAMVEDSRITVAAASRDQADTLRTQADDIIRRSAEYLDDEGRPLIPAGAYRSLTGYRRILCPGSHGRLQVFPATDVTGDGTIPTLAILEELHRHPTLALYRTWGGKLHKRGGQMVVISTAGEPGSDYEETKAAALANCARTGEVRREAGLIVATSPGFEMRLHAVADDEDLEDLDAVKRANPLSTVTRAVLEEKRADPTWSINHWARFTCGRPTRTTSSAISEQEWAKLPKGEIPPGETVDVGADFAWKLDTTALVPLWLPRIGSGSDPDPKVRVFGVPEIVTPPRDGTSLDPAEVRAAFIRIMDRNPIRRVAMDPNAGGIEMQEWLERPPGIEVDPETGEERKSYAYEEGHGLGVEVVEVSQGNVVQCAVYTDWMEAVRERWIHHPHDPDFTRHVLNAIAKPVGHDRYRFDRPNPSRAASQQHRRVIDALTAASGVHWQVCHALEPDKPVDLEAYRVTMI